MSEWQPIETAPKDGTKLWLVESGAPSGLSGPRQFMGYWVKDRRYEDGGYWRSFGFSMFRDDPTHWMPLPEPPR